MRKRATIHSLPETPLGTGAEPATNVAADQLLALFTPAQLDSAIDRAARFSRSTVAMFVASPTELWVRGALQQPTGIEIVVEFFVPPMRRDEFVRELDEQFCRLSPDYAIGRQQGRFAAPLLQAVPAGTFHQWRVARRYDDFVRTAQRWSRDRRIVNSVLDQARVGWHELTS